MSAGIPRFVTVNLRQLNEKFQEGEEVSLETLQQKNLLNLSGREASLPLKVCCLSSPCTGVMS
jgi:large subunit ribosomal protein L15